MSILFFTVRTLLVVDTTLQPVGYPNLSLVLYYQHPSANVPRETISLRLRSVTGNHTLNERPQALGTLLTRHFCSAQLLAEHPSLPLAFKVSQQTNPQAVATSGTWRHTH